MLVPGPCAEESLPGEHVAAISVRFQHRTQVKRGMRFEAATHLSLRACEPMTSPGRALAGVQGMQVGIRRTAPRCTECINELLNLNQLFK